ncbi:MAG: 5-(carboxyamino)imidazole ribonucleotide synthase [Bacillota bacterium]|nr:MAG: 5-(carboxyamino)imidazole ribonucleotide synthase [Bacillota bacterium]
MSKRVILPGSTIGILGGGQLGRMTAIEAKKMGYRVLCLDPTPDSPCGQVSDGQIVGSFNDLAAAEKLAEQSDVLVYEFENISASVVGALEQQYYVPQGSEILSITQHRVLEKGHLAKHLFPIAPYAVVNSEARLICALEQIGYPAVLKSATGGYDGKGQQVLRSQDDIPAAMALCGRGGQFVLEKFVQLLGEVSVIVARNGHGTTSLFPVAENLHRDNILHTTVVPARINASLEEEAQSLAKRIADSLQLVGILAVEMFVTPQGLMVNELAPRPHNSGHFSFGACHTSQFEQFVRAVCGLPFGSTELLFPAVMVNVLGADMPSLMKIIPYLPTNVKLHLYGKSGQAQYGRKMGHLLIKTNEPDLAIEWAEETLWGLKV